MNEYLKQAYDQRKETADLYRSKLLEIQATIIQRSDDHKNGVKKYSNEERIAHRDELNKAMRRLTLAIDSILEIEEDLK